MAEGTSLHVKSALRTLDIIEYVIAHQRPLVAQQISAALGIPLSSLSYLLATLVDRGYLAREGRKYSPGPGLQRLQARDRAFTLAEMVAPLTRTLRVQLDETSTFFVCRDWHLEALVTETSDQALRYAVPTGSQAALHSVSAGKALLAQLDEADLADYFAQTSLQSFTPNTVTTEEALRAELRTIRDTGIARTTGEHTTGIVGLGRAARLGGEVVGAFSVAIPTVRFNAEVERRVIDLLIKTTAMLDAE